MIDNKINSDYSSVYILNRFFTVVSFLFFFFIIIIIIIPF